MARPVKRVSRPTRHGNSGLDIDEIDEVMEKRSKALATLHKREDDIDSQVESDEEEILPLGLSDSDEDDDDRANGDGDEDLDAWGKNKRVYYSTDKVNDEERQQVEKEARRLRSQQLSEMNVNDFMGGDDSFASLLAIRAQEGSSSVSHRKKNSTNGIHSLDNYNLSTNGDVEIITKDMSGLSREEQLRILLKESPEFTQLVVDLSANLSEIRQHLVPVVQRTAKLRTDKGISLLEIKYHLLLNYCTNILFYLLRKAEGKSVKDHPVIDHLVKLRIILEKIKPLESKLKYQIDKLVKTAASGDAASDDPLQFKPHPAHLVPKHHDDNESDEEDGDEYKGRGDEDAVYRIPKMTPVAYDGDVKPSSKTRDSHRDRLARTRILTDLQAEFSLAPEEVDESLTAESAQDVRYARHDARLAAIEQHEEDHFVRLPVSKKDKQRMKQRSQAHMQLEDVLEDLGEYANLMDKKHAEGADVVPSKRHQKTSQALAEAIGQLEAQQGSIASSRRSRHGDDDIPYKSLEHSQSGYGSSALQDVGGHESDEKSDGEEQDEYYQEIQKAKRARKEIRDDAHTKVHTMPEDQTLDGSKRHVSRDIMKNRGLTAYKKKELRNPRVKHREKYGKAIKRLANIKPKAAVASSHYGGEATGIKANISKSVRFH